LMASRIRFVAFDLDGTLIRGLSLCEVLAEPLGRLERMRALEEALRGDERAVRAAGEEMVGWYGVCDREALCAPLRLLELAAGAEKGIALLRDAGVSVGIVSTTWSFGVAVVAARLGVDTYAGTELLHDGEIRYFRPEDKAVWLRKRSHALGVRLDEVAAVGDSLGDRYLLREADLAYYVGEAPPPPEFGALHRPLGDIAEIAREILSVGDEAMAVA
jgi:HAD superfamily phosphoserine phosphatase-like hydrolase